MTATRAKNAALPIALTSNPGATTPNTAVKTTAATTTVATKARVVLEIMLGKREPPTPGHDHEIESPRTNDISARIALVTAVM